MAHQITKVEAATRQINAAIRLFFLSSDPVAIHTLTAAAANIFSDLADHHVDIESWRERIRKDNGMSHAEVKNILHKSWNFFKHAGRDPEATLNFDESETDHIIFLATLECGEIVETSIEMQVFQLWYLASGTFKLDPDSEIQHLAETLFPGLEHLPRNEQLLKGNQMLIAQLAGLHEET